MKSLLRKILLGNASAKDYQSVTLAGDAAESVWLQADGQTIDVSKNHWVLALDPMVFGIWLEKKSDVLKARHFNLYFRGPAPTAGTGPLLARLSLNYFDAIDEPGGSLLLLQVQQSRIYHVSPLKARLLFLNYYKTPQTDFRRLKALAAAFSYPRQVRVVSFGQDDEYNIFPMDLLGEMNAGGNFVFGLRHSNASLAKMMETKKMVVAEVCYQHKDAIYQLGKYHSTTIPPPASLPFPLVKSEQFGFYVPAWADSYTELDIVKTINLGSHMLLWAKTASRTRLKDSTGHLFHLHSLAWLRQQQNGQSYSLV
jgi:hypothetical protein